jgi:WD40 repeat protein
MENKVIQNFVYLPVDNNILIDPLLIKESQKEFISDYICVVCHHIVIKPKMCKNCHNIFCGRCIKKTVEITGKCPFKCYFYEQPLTRPMFNLLNNFKFKCPGKNCPSEDIPYENMYSHLLNDCQFIDKKAKCLGCNYIFDGKVIEQHISQCNRIKVECKDCLKLIVRKDLKDHSYICEERISKCKQCGIYLSILNFKHHSEKECMANRNQVDISETQSNVTEVIESCEIWNKTKIFGNFSRGKVMIQLYDLSNKPLIALSGINNTIEIWDLDKEEAIIRLTGNYSQITALLQVETYTDIIKLLSGDSNGIIKAWSIKDNTCTEWKTHKAHAQDINYLLQLSTTVLASGSSDRTIKLWNLNDYSIICTFSGHTGIVSCLSGFSIRPNILLSSSYDKTIRLWDIEKKANLYTFYGHLGEIEKIISLENYYNRVLSCANDGLIKFWNIDSYQCVQTLKAHELPIWHMIKLVNFEILITGDKSNIKVIRLPDLKILFEFKSVEDEIINVMELSNLQNPTNLLVLKEVCIEINDIINKY